MVEIRGVADCVLVGVHTSNTVIMTDLSKYFTLQKWELRMKEGLKTNGCVITSMPCSLKPYCLVLLRSHKDMSCSIQVLTQYGAIQSFVTGNIHN